MLLVNPREIIPYINLDSANIKKEKLLTTNISSVSLFPSLTRSKTVVSYYPMPCPTTTVNSRLPTVLPWQPNNVLLIIAFKYHKLQILHTNRRNSKQTRKLLYFHAKLGYYHGNSRLLRDSIILPQSPPFQRHQKRKKRGPPTTPVNPSTLKIPNFKPFFNTFACEYPNSYGIIFL